MAYLTFGAKEYDTYKIAILVNEIRKDDIEKNYLEPYNFNLGREEIIVLTLEKNLSARDRKTWITQELAPLLRDLEVEYLLVGDGDYFKTLTKKTKVDSYIGYVLDTDYGPWKLAYVPAYRSVFYDPLKVTAKIAQGVNALQSWIQGTYKDPGIDIIMYARYPETIEEIEFYLDQLIRMDTDVTVDIEGFSLKHYSAGIGTIAFAFSQGEGIAFPVDILDDPGHSIAVRELLKSFFKSFKRKLLFHNIGYDACVLIYNLFMKDLLDNKGLLEGMEILLRDWDDTKLIAYLATNSCAGNRLGLKEQAQEFAGNYAVDEIRDIRKIPLPQLLQYNLVDCLSTWFVHDKHYPTMVADQQVHFYETIFKPAMVDIIQMQLTGMPVDMERVKQVRQLLEVDHQRALIGIHSSHLVREFVYQLDEEWVEARNQEYKKKVVTFEDANEEFNPNSGPQLGRLLHEMIGLPIIATTDTGLPATDGDTLKALVNHTSDPDVLNLLEALADHRAVAALLTGTIPALESAQLGPDGWHYLFGNFNLGGTISGRLSSSEPNLQNLPAKEGYSKLIKSCFRAPPGWFFCGIDFSSLEDKISGLTTKDPNKLKVYIDGYDGHSLRAFSYFGDRMSDIIDTVESINSIKKLYPDLRQDSKAPTFALTYQGTWKTLMTNCGFPEEQARSIEAKYHELYKVSDEWIDARLQEAGNSGYVLLAFGLRLRTPLLKQVVRGTSKTPYEATAEGRSAGNALGQSWCLLNSRAGSEFMGKVRSSEFRHTIKPCAQIHDAQYYLVKDDIRTLHFANTHVVIACEWQDDPAIWHDQVRLGGEFSIFWPDWSHDITIPNGVGPDEITGIFREQVSS